jgi:hypothetical protein
MRRVIGCAALAVAGGCATRDSPAPRLHWDWAHPCRICTGTGLTPAASAPGLRYDRYVRVKAYELLRWMAQAHHIEHNVLPTAGPCTPVRLRSLERTTPRSPHPFSSVESSRPRHLGPRLSGDARFPHAAALVSRAERSVGR